MSVVEEIKQRGFKKYIAILLFGMIILVFVFLGTYSGNEQVGPGFAARVNDQIISVREYKNSLDQMINFYAQMFGGEFDAEAQKRMRIRTAALEQLISRSAMVQAAGKSGLIVPAEEIRDVITSIPAFQEAGKFRREYYDNFLANRRLSASQFEDDLKKDILAGKIREVFQSGLTPSPLEISKLNELSRHKLNVEFIKIDAGGLEKNIKVSDSEAQQLLATPEGEKRARDLFELNKGLYAKEEQVRARHILVKADFTNPESDKAALAKIQKAQEQIKTKAFDAVARELSEDEGSKANGGDLGFFGRNRMVKEFETAAFSQEIGAVGQPVKTAYGYHIIKVEAKNPKTEANFDNAKISIAKGLVAQDRTEKLTSQIKEALAKNSVAEVSKIASQYGLKWEETGSFALSDATIPKIGDAEAVFSVVSGLTEQSPLHKDVITSGPEQFVIRLKSKTIVESKVTPEKQVEETQQRLAMTRLRDAFKNWNDAIVKSSRVERNAALLEGEVE